MANLLNNCQESAVLSVQSFWNSIWWNHIASNLHMLHRQSTSSK